MGNGAAGFGGLAVSYNAGGNGEIINPSDCVGPLTGHIMWTKPIQGGGVVGGETGLPIQGDTYFEGSAYSERYANPIIVEGLLIYNPPVSFTGVSSGPTTCVSLSTGQVMWQSNNAANVLFANGVGYVPSISICLHYMTFKTKTNTESTHRFSSQLTSQKLLTHVQGSGYST